MSEVIEQPVIDKSSWPQGPWMTEPDRLDWVHAGFVCILTRHPTLGHLCGYVGVDKKHPYHGKVYNDFDVEVHGGLTYAAACHGKICHVPTPGMPDDVWWLGFDCGHAWDISPGMSAMLKGVKYPYSRDDIYRTIEYVKQQVEGLAEQLRERANDYRTD